MNNLVQGKLIFPEGEIYDSSKVVDNVYALVRMHKSGLLGGETMPEDARPEIIEVDSEHNYHFLTLPMALNYQRNSYVLWKSAAATYLDDQCRDVFNPSVVTSLHDEVLRRKLLKHKVALQPNKHTDTWARVCKAINDLLGGDIRNIFYDFDNDVVKIKEFMQLKNKSHFPYLSGEKICNYWLYVIDSYTPTKLKNRDAITIAPDTHVLQASIKLGVVNQDIALAARDRGQVAEKWRDILEGTNIAPIDIHTPLWLWSRAGFPKITD